MTNHTPGPWEPRYETPGWPWLSIISPTRRRETDASHAVCLLRAWTADPERDANARLIAAAPEMLVALVACWEQLACFCTEHDEDNTTKACKLAFDAIEKATGGDIPEATRSLWDRAKRDFSVLSNEYVHLLFENTRLRDQVTQLGEAKK